MAKLGPFTADAPYTQMAVITPHDSNNIQLNSVDTPCDAIYVGGAGDVALVDQHGNAFTFKAMPLGVYRLAARRINATNTTATNLLALYY